MELIIVSDIFGRTLELEDIALQLSSPEREGVIVDPYGGKYREFKDEAEAYSHFQRHVGIERYKDIVLKAVTRSRDNLLLIGFSVGASAIWAISDETPIRTNAEAICFYGSQIRNFSGVSPKIKMELIFPEYEPHFDVGYLISQLSLKSNVSCHTAPYLHGFMNKKSVNFNESAYQHYLRLLRASLEPVELPANA